ncbi:hypothetical protein LINPERPRIM_LOCUS17332 [Linum perenne]
MQGFESRFWRRAPSISCF